MKKITALVAVFLLLATTVMACLDCEDPDYLEGTHIWTDLMNTGGYTEFVEETTIGGYDWTEDRYVVTGVIHEEVVNDGTVNIHGVMSSYSPWELEEMKFVDGTGYTEIYKNVQVWTEDPREDDCGDLKWPTETWVETAFATDTETDLTNAYFLMDEPPAEDNIGVFKKEIVTDDDYFFFEKVGINNFPSDYEPPERPESPDFFCDWGQLE